jgi:protein-tyrosine-phosphatase
MAQALFEDIVNKHSSLGPAGLEVDSAGTAVVMDTQTAEAAEIMREYGLSLASHRSKRVSASLVDWADLILVMEFRQWVQVVSQFPAATKKTHILSEYVGDTGDIADPYSCGIEAYRECAALLQRLLNKVAEMLKI